MFEEADRPAPRWPDLAVPIEVIPGIGPTRRRAMGALGVATVEDLLRLLPRRHEDRSHVSQIAELVAGTPALVDATVLSASAAPFRGRSAGMLRARLSDGSGVLDATWFLQPHLGRWLVPGARLRLYGRVDAFGRGLVMRAPEVESLDRRGSVLDEPEAPPGLVPVYPLSAGLQQRAMRGFVRHALERWGQQVPETVPRPWLQRLDLAGAATAWHDAHFPPDPAALEAARRRVAFEELLHLQLGLAVRRRERTDGVRGFRHVPPGDLTRRFMARLPYVLTGAQRRVLDELDRDLLAPRPMYRLLQGDVGSGKTVVAAALMVRAVEGGGQAALLAPTEVLAEQHHATLRRLYAGVCSVESLTAAAPRRRRERVLAGLAAGTVHVLVGTHAMLQPDVRFQRLALAVTDEQHRFGVRQRDQLSAKGAAPDLLVMTATPIPRSLAMTLYGDLEVSTINELPPGRLPVRTFHRTPAGRGRVYDFVRAQVREGRQAFIVCPQIAPGRAEEAMGAAAEPHPADAGEDASPQGADLPPDDRAGAAVGRSAATGAGVRASIDEPSLAAEVWVDVLRRRWPEMQVGLLHGRLPLAERERTMAAFVAGDVQVLVATTVIEVGVDVPNASVMVVEGADRFGLAQLHQLRGRVGRGRHDSYCILIADGAGERLDLLTRCTDGFVIAEADLQWRGPGEILGTRQHGLPELRWVDPLRDGALLTQARQAALDVLERDPGLNSAENEALRAAVEGLFGAGRG